MVKLTVISLFLLFYLLILQTHSRSGLNISGCRYDVIICTTMLYQFHLELARTLSVFILEVWMEWHRSLVSLNIWGTLISLMLKRYSSGRLKLVQSRMNCVSILWSLNKAVTASISITFVVYLLGLFSVRRTHSSAKILDLGSAVDGHCVRTWVRLSTGSWHSLQWLELEP